MTEQWTLRTASTAYTVGVGPDGTALLLLGWGPSDEPAGWSRPAAANTSWELDADLAPVEYASAGTRQAARPDLVVDHGDGLTGVRWAYQESTCEQDEAAGHLMVRFADTTGALRLDLHTRTSREHDVVRRWSEIHNVSDDRTVVLRRALSGGWTVPAPLGARLGYLSGRWSREFVPRHVDLRAGELVIGSRQGITSHEFAPWVTAQPLAGDGEPDETAGTYSAQLAWSGSWQLAAEARPAAGVVRLALGLADDALAVPLGPAESFACPETLGLWTLLGPDAAAREWHRYQRLELSRSTGPEHRPVVYNSWYATTFAVRAEHQLALADAAAEIGAEVFVVDDGWFRGRDTDTRGLGDWTPDPAAFPDGLGALAEQVLARGMRFGLWVEPEAVNPDSDLYRAHPDWVYRAGDRPLTTMRHQLVLDLGRSEVVAWVEDTLRRLLTRYPVSYLKWDMNRPVTDGGRPGDARSGRWAVDHAAGYLGVMQMLRSEFPDLTVEACAGGGGRIDAAVLGVSDVVWPSDETGPRDRLVIQDGFLRCYPPHVMSSWVTDQADSSDTRATSLEFRFVVAMAGVLGVGADLLEWSAEQRKTAVGLVELYKRVRRVVHEGAVQRVGDPRTGLHSVQYAGDDRHGQRIVVLVWDGRVERSAGIARVRVPAAHADRSYRMPDGSVVSGSTLARQGLDVPWSLAPDADIVVLEPLPPKETHHDG